MVKSKTPRKQLAVFVEGFGLKPSYRVTQSPQRSGAQQTWVVEAYIRFGRVPKVRILGIGEGRTKRGAYNQAAQVALRAEVSRIQLLQGHTGSEKGFLAERRVLNLISHPPKQLPIWVVDARLATKEEDGRGIDIVVSTTHGPMWIQVKSSHGAARKHAKKYPNTPIAIVVVHPTDTDRYLFDQIVSGLRSLLPKSDTS